MTNHQPRPHGDGPGPIDCPCFKVKTKDANGNALYLSGMARCDNCGPHDFNPCGWRSAASSSEPIVFSCEDGGDPALPNTWYFSGPSGDMSRLYIAQGALRGNTDKSQTHWGYEPVPNSSQFRLRYGAYYLQYDPSNHFVALTTDQSKAAPCEFDSDEGPPHPAAQGRGK